MAMPRVQGRIVPTVDVDLYADDVVEDSSVAFEEIRRTAPVVWLPRNRMWALGRYEDVRAALRDEELFTSDGVAANPIANLSGCESILFSNGDKHANRRSVMMRSLSAKALAPVADRLDREADSVVKGLVGAGEFEAIRDLASTLPLRVVADLVGLRVSAERLGRWGPPIFDQLGPLNRRWRRHFPTALGISAQALRLSRSRVVPGSWAASVFDASERGELGWVEARAMVLDFVVPSLDTTILAIAHMVWLLGRNPDVWARLRREPDLVPAAVVEAVRLCSPVRCFARRVSREAELGGVQLHAGDRVALLFGAANMDASQFPEPDRFDLDRPSAGNLGWGHGPHACIGARLAKQEMRAVLGALLAHVETIETAERPRRIRNNTLQGIASLPARLS